MKPLLIATLVVACLAAAACSTKSAATPHVTITVTKTSTATQPAPSASTQSTPASSPTPAPTAGCLSRYLHGATGLSQGTAGAIDVTITFRNLNNAPCTLYGFPGIALAAGKPVTDVGHPSVENSTTARELVTLQPGGFAHATLQIIDAGNYSASVCQPENTTWLAVIPPNQRIPLYIPLKSTACKGSPKLLTVTAVRPGTGG